MLMRKSNVFSFSSLPLTNPLLFVYVTDTDTDVTDTEFEKVVGMHSYGKIFGA